MRAYDQRSFLTQNRLPLLASAGAHVLLLGLLLASNLVVIPRQPMPQLAIEAVIVDEGAIRRATETERQRTEAAARRQREAEAQRQAEQRRAEEAAAQRVREEQQRRETEARQQREAEQQRQAEAERQRQQAEAEQRRQAEAAAAEKRRQEAEAQARREQEQRAAEERARAEAARRDQQRREAELAAALAAEEDLLRARQSGEMNRYLALIQQRVERNWIRPPSAVAGLQCEVAVVQLPNGDVVDVRIIRCDGDDAVRRSVEAAVRRSSPLPLPDNRALFERNLRFVFKPEQ